MAFVSVAFAAGAQQVTPGGELSLTPDSGATRCAIGYLTVPCATGFSGTYASSDSAQLKAEFDDTIGTGIGEPHAATAGLRSDFSIAGTPDTLVPVQISVSYDLFAALLGTAAYESSAEITLLVEDVSQSPAETVGSTSLFRQDRSGDQGFTDVTTGREVYNLSGESGQLQLLLRRGHTYRVWFTAQAVGEQFVIGKSRSTSSATLRGIKVRVDEDEVAQLATHDREVKQQLDRIEQKVDLLLRTQLEQSLVAPRGSNLTVMQTERLDELCAAAQTAIDSANDLGYRVKTSAQGKVSLALRLKESDPKRAVDLCRSAYQSAAFPRTREPDAKPAS